MKIKKEQQNALVLIGALIAIGIFYILYINDFHFAYMITLVWLIIIIPLIVFGNKIISRTLQKHLPWEKYLSKRFFVQLLSVLMYSLLCFNLSYFAFKFIFTNDPPAPGQIAIVNIYGCLIVLPIYSIYYVVYFINEWKKSQLRSEKLEKESIKSQFDNLKNHLDPHFLFNNLNILSSLIDTDVSSSKQYLTRFAEVYRFMLLNKSSELITLQQELEFSKAYFHLICVRYKEALDMEENIPSVAKQKFIPPFTLQMLIENAVKHNAFSRQKPMLIEIMASEDNLIVRNNVKKPVSSVSSNGTGLKNISGRYKYFTDREVNIVNDGTYFEVKIPLIEIEEL